MGLLEAQHWDIWDKVRELYYDLGYCGLLWVCWGMGVFIIWMML